MATRNEPIGEVLCPARECERTVPVFRFRARPAERMRRFAGKLYCRCPDHGQMSPQEYLLNKATIWGPEKGNDAPAEVKNDEKLPAIQKAPAPKKAPAKKPAAPAPEPAKEPAKQKPKARGWGFFE